MRVGYREVATRTVHVPSDLEVIKDVCSLDLKRANKQGAIAPPGAVEDPHHLAEWETFTRVLLTFHTCIFDLTLHVSAVRRPPRQFYQSISLQSGIAQINVEVSAYTDPYRDFMLPFMCHLFRLRNPDRTEVQVYDIRGHDDLYPREKLCTEHLKRDDSPQLNDNRFGPIMEATMDMPSLLVFEIDLHNTVTVPGDLPDIALRVSSSGSSELRRLRYEVDIDCASLLQCAHLEQSACGNQIDTSLLPRLSARRELTGSTRDLVPYLVEVNSSDYVYNLVLISIMRDEDASG
ncbi:uncharacterized protein LOC119392863 isoform X1 [Rhipicephalus sanguineus]|uniref:uncharacterized protein LOC119392863 isoform X1 n=1 Tax=Rhipicephalus sanguineus TaxID=34632 RepID=UPI001895B345|nr:uncharacterized protein LOC119392863 isoform X1 [Rhipicephalus sanguineus]